MSNKRERYVRIIRNVCLTAMIVLILHTCSGCSGLTKENGEMIEYSICLEKELPGELSKIIDEQKNKQVGFSFINSNNTYIVVCYGERERKDYGIRVKELYETRNAIYVSTELAIKENQVASDSSVTKEQINSTKEDTLYPYIVIKIKRLDKPVLFDLD